MLIVGEREQGDGAVSVRAHHGGDLGAMALEQFAERLRGELYSTSLKPSKSSERRV